MSAANLQRILEQVGNLSPQERLELQSFLATPPSGGAPDALSRKLREMGLVRHPQKAVRITDSAEAHPSDGQTCVANAD